MTQPNTKTEKEASAAWCPFARHMVLMNRPAPNLNASPDLRRVAGNAPEPVGVAAVNRWESGDRAMATHCFASGCMMWRWEFSPDHVPREEWQGYCGLANWR